MNPKTSISPNNRRKGVVFRLALFPCGVQYRLAKATSKKHASRHYASWLGRWTAVDPAGLVDGVNLYMYCRGNPVKLVDSTGESTEEVKNQSIQLGNFSEMLDENLYNKIFGMVNNLPDGPIRGLFEKYGANLKIASVNSMRDGESHFYYCSAGKEIHLNTGYADSDYDASPDRREANRLNRLSMYIFHEIGHAFDHLAAGDSLVPLSSTHTYNDKHLVEAIVEDVKDRLDDIEKRFTSFFAGEPPKGLPDRLLVGGYINRELHARLKKHEGNLSADMLPELNKHSALEMRLHRKGSHATYLKDIFSGASIVDETIGGRIGNAYMPGRKDSYWGNDGVTLSTEAFAHMFATSIVCSAALGVIEREAPKTYHFLKNMLGVMPGIGR